MLIYEKIFCSDEITRFCRIQKIKPHRIKSKNRIKSENIPEKFNTFVEYYSEFSKSYLGFEIKLLSKYSSKKIHLLESIFQNLKVYQISNTYLFLKAQFEYAKNRNPRAIWLGKLSSLMAIKIYKKWIEKFNGEKDAQTRNIPSSLEEVITENHKRLIYYKEKTGLLELTILKTRAKEFDPVYLITFPEFIECISNTPNLIPANVKGGLDTVLSLLKDPQTATLFLETVRRIKKCIPEKVLTL